VPVLPAVYVADLTSGTVSVINRASNTVTVTVTVEKNPTGVAVSPHGDRAYVADQGANTVSVIDTAANSVTGTITIETNPRGVAAL